MIYEIKEWRKIRQIKFEWGHLGYEVVIGETSLRGNKIELIHEKVSASVLSRLEKGEYTSTYVEGDLYVYEGTKQIHHQTGRPYYGIEFALNKSVGSGKLLKYLDNLEYITEYTEPQEGEEVIKTTYGAIPSGKRFEVVPYGWSGTVLGTNEDGSILIYLKEINKAIEKKGKAEVTLVYRNEPRAASQKYE